MAASQATSAVFGITELLENILVILPPRDLLRCHSVSKTFHATIEGSKQLKKTLFWEIDYRPSAWAPFGIFFERPRRTLAGGEDHLLHQRTVRSDLFSGTFACEFSLLRSKAGATFNWTTGRKPTLMISLDDIWDMHKLEEDAMSSFGRCSLTDPAERMNIDLTFLCPSIRFISSAKDPSWKRLLGRSRPTKSCTVDRKVRMRVATRAVTMRQALDICRVLILLHSEYSDVSVPGLSMHVEDLKELYTAWHKFDHRPAEWRGNSGLHTRVADLLSGPILVRSALRLRSRSPDERN
ncbi:uncharacterized protein MYCFIDRAFT_198780 [Pseudocercospora fijiensis CIRAD86]|uniref:F-box domain-containing protein n=1 Tax=Pseudocercospora fijiensis (strain CIRAD86) TaxID=383855 RepID=M2ZNB8_PSEFD|nr:uncharacterized protein MYCFIDRAFT_198780 [Pseudocercospora fijiensis CIRAD86]EME80594.1 hypothetical protein MYCFIDRAFT_198780 [Pseudocercospora fijiensis CIRAD86]